MAKVIEAKTKDEMGEADRRVEAKIEALKKIIDDAKTDAATLKRTALEMLKLSQDFNKILDQRKKTKHDAAKAKTSATPPPPPPPPPLRAPKHYHYTHTHNTCRARTHLVA